MYLFFSLRIGAGVNLAGVNETSVYFFFFLFFGFLILTLNNLADDHEGLWMYGEAGQCTDEKLQTVRDPIPLSALALSLFIIFD